MDGRKRKVFLVIAAVSCVAALSLGACAPSSGASSDGGAATTEAGWSTGSDCQTCHAVAADSGSEVASLSATHGSNACMTCHADDSGALAAAHEGATAASDPAKLTVTEVSNDACLTCHSLETVSKTTEEWGGKEGVNPHNSMHGVAVTCTDCHVAHEKSTLACNECHGWKLPTGWLQPSTY